MTVNELVTLLNKYPGATRVVVCGYEGGYCDVSDAEPLNLLLDCNKKWYYGPHESADDSYYRKEFPGKPIEPAILIRS